jgi:hypothetical protein
MIGERYKTIGERYMTIIRHLFARKLREAVTDTTSTARGRGHSGNPYSKP